jgi:hypothetical protein
MIKLDGRLVVFQDMQLGQLRGSFAGKAVVGDLLANGQNRHKTVIIHRDHLFNIPTL